jgi:tetratricopeptide (TPR) repeat protein
MKNCLKLTFLLLFYVCLASITVFAQSKPDEKQKEDAAKGSSMARPINTSVYDERIAEARKAVEKNPKKSESKKKLAQAYADRGFALTDAAQYKAALGDFRRCLKLNPENKKQEKYSTKLQVFLRA